MTQKAQTGDTVKIHYTLELEDGTMFDTTEGQEPLEFAIGSEDIITGISDSIVGMEAGDRKTLTLAPEEAYGEYQDRLVISVPKEKVMGEVKVGSILADEGTQSNWLVKEIHDDHVVLDGNHLLAGKTLTFKIELVSIGAVSTIIQ